MILFRQSCTRAFSSMWARPMEVMPRMAFMGVRMSWDILDKNRLFAWLASSASRRAASSAAFTRASSSCSSEERLSTHRA